MFIQKIILNNFRIFRGKHEFDFSNKKVVVVEGPNGHGKSTIFDAINWAISGKIFRYVGSSEHQQFNYIINNDAYSQGVDEASVEIFFKGEEEVIIKRTVKKNGPPKILINGERLGIREGQKEIVRLLVNENIINDPNLIEAIDLPSFIESTLVLSQENLEDFVRGNKPTERYSKLEQILGLTRYGQDFKDYLQILKKEYLEQYGNILSNQSKIKHQRELLDAQYQPILQQNVRNGNKPKSKILEELNQFFSSLRNPLFGTFNNIQKYNDVTQDEYEILLQFIETIDGNLKRLAAFKFEIEQKEIYVYGEGFDEKVINVKQEINTLKEQKFKRECGIKKANLIREKLNKVSQTNTYLDIKKTEKEKIELEIKNIKEKLQVIARNLGISYESLNSNHVINFIKEFKAKDDSLKSLLEKRAIKEYEVHLIGLTNKEGVYKTDIDKKNKIVDELRNESETLENKILQLTNKKKTNLEAQINTLIHEVQTHLINSNEEICLVCGTAYDSSQDLRESIGIQLDNTNDLLSKFEKIINEYKVEKNNVITKLSLGEQELLVAQQELEKLKKEIEDLKNKIEVMRLRNSVDWEDSKQIETEIETLKNYKINNNNKYNGFKEIEKSLLMLNDLKLRREEISEEEKNIINQHNSYQHFIRNEKKLKLKQNNIDSYINCARSKIQHYNKQILEYRQYIEEIDRKLQILTEIKSELEELLNCQLQLDSNGVLNVIVENINIFEKVKYESRGLLLTIEKYLNDIKLREIENQIKKYDQESLILDKQIEQYVTMDEQLKDLIGFHTEVQSSLVNEYLDGLSLTINNYFRQISPHSYFNYINLVAIKNELFVLLNDNQLNYKEIKKNIDESVNASLTLSAAQSTILAMSIFLALNKTQNWSKLNVIGIDDPFQNLDDINAYSFIDVLANLISVEDRQIFISTHDSDFAKLTIRKMNLNPDEFGYVKIQSYTREAIEIQSEQYYSLGE
jgi:DNA repair protein SbcC/Rad50